MRAFAVGNEWGSDLVEAVDAARVLAQDRAARVRCGPSPGDPGASSVQLVLQDDPCRFAVDPGAKTLASPGPLTLTAFGHVFTCEIRFVFCPG